MLVYFAFALQNVTLSDRKQGLTIDHCARHIWPQSWGYAFEPRGVGRLDFMGRMERFDEDWAKLVAALEARTAGGVAPPTPARMTRPNVQRHVHRRVHAEYLKEGGEGYAALAREPFLTRALAWDQECLWGTVNAREEPKQRKDT